MKKLLVVLLLTLVSCDNKKHLYTITAGTEVYKVDDYHRSNICVSSWDKGKRVTLCGSFTIVREF